MKPIPPGSKPLLNLAGEETYLQTCYFYLDVLVSVTPESKAVLLRAFIDNMMDTRPDWQDAPPGSKEATDAETWRERYLTFLNTGEAGDTLAEFDGFPYMPIMSGRAGIVILRGDRVVSIYTTRMS